MRLLAEHSQDVEEKKMLLFLCSRQGTDHWKRLLAWRPTLYDLLVTFPRTQPPLARLIDAVLPLAPRHYSITSSPLENPTSVHCAFNVVEYETTEPVLVHRKGVCTPWLDLVSGQVPAAASLSNELAPVISSPANALLVPIFPHPSKDFLVPEDLSIPWIMVGPGTGVAPFVGFCKHRKHMLARDKPAAVGAAWLFYGCRHRERDFLYKQELSALAKDQQVLTKLVTCFSREPETLVDKKYVQHELLAHGEAVHRMMVQEKGRLFVCGYV